MSCDLCKGKCPAPQACQVQSSDDGVEMLGRAALYGIAVLLLIVMGALIA